MMISNYTNLRKWAYRLILILVLLTLRLEVYSCDCTLGDIATSYKSSSVIFYGKYLGQKKAEDYSGPLT